MAEARHVFSEEPRELLPVVGLVAARAAEGRA